MKKHLSPGSAGRSALKRTLFTLATASLALSASIANAHHAYAPEFGSSVISCAEGVVTDIRWRSPHIQLDVELTGRYEQPFPTLTLQSQAPSILRRNYKLEEDSIKPGDTIQVRGRISVLGTNIFQMLTLSVNGSPEMALSTKGIPEIGQLREENTGSDRDRVRQTRDTGGAVTDVKTQCESYALF